MTVGVPDRELADLCRGTYAKRYFQGNWSHCYQAGSSFRQLLSKYPVNPGELRPDRDHFSLSDLESSGAPLKWLKPRPESGLDCLICSELTAGAVVALGVPD